MPRIKHEQWLEWKNHPVTSELREAVRERVNEVTEHVMNSASNTRDFDQFCKGMVRAFTEVLDYKPDQTIDIEDIENAI